MKYIFTTHATKRAKMRQIPKEEILNAITFPNKTIKKHEKYIVQRKVTKGIIEVIYVKSGKYIKIVTAYWL